MISRSNKTAFQNNKNEDHDFPLAVAGFNYSDLYKPEKLKELCEVFYRELGQTDADLLGALMQYIEARGAGYEKKAESELLVNAAPHLTDFIVRLFGIEEDYAALAGSVKIQDPIWKYKFFVQRRAIKKFNADAVASLDIAELDAAVDALKTAFDVPGIDEELSIAAVTSSILDLEEDLTKEQPPTNETVKTIVLGFEHDIVRSLFGGEAADSDLLKVQAVLRLLEAWSAYRFFNKPDHWKSLKTPHTLDYQNLVHIVRPSETVPEDIRGLDSHLRRRDGFKLTDDRGTMRDALYEIDYCLICHERDKDSCSTGLREKDGTPKRKPARHQDRRLPARRKNLGDASAEKAGRSDRRRWRWSRSTIRCAPAPATASATTA